jgi:hypothetical protein
VLPVGGVAVASSPPRGATVAALQFTESDKPENNGGTLAVKLIKAYKRYLTEIDPHQRALLWSQNDARGGRRAFRCSTETPKGVQCRRMILFHCQKGQDRCRVEDIQPEHDAW